MFTLKSFQENTISELRKNFLNLWSTGKRQLELIFKSPTGSGKTVMVAQLLRDLTGDPQFNEDKAFIWFSFNQESYEQSKDKLFKYYGGAGEINLMDLTNLTSDARLEKNSVFFINWQKVKTSTKEGRKLRKKNENDITFDSFVKKTQEDSREIVLIIDEAHRDSKTELAQELIDLIDPRIILKITATPTREPSYSEVKNNEVGYVEVSREEVVEEGLIKEKVITQTKEDIEKQAKKEIDQDLLILDMAYQKRIELKKYYEKLKKDINPLVLIQLPNDDKARKETLDKSKKDIVLDFLKDKGEDDHNIAVWLSEKKENLEEIEKDNSEVNFLIFKQAAATGWDCPRAGILVMFREIKSPTFQIQTVGRILRMPEAIHYPVPDLNIGYLYTNYDRTEILKEYENKQGENKPATEASRRKDDIKPIELDSVFMSRTDYNDLGDSFQNTFKQVANKYFNIKAKDTKSQIKKKLEKKDLEIKNPKVTNNLIVDAEIENYDNFIEELKINKEELENEVSRNDLERSYNLICFNIISQQEDEDKKFAPERSWGKIKTALNVYFSNLLDVSRVDYYKMIVNDLLKPNSVIRPIIGDTLKKYRPIREKEVQRKSERKKRTEKLEIPRETLFFTDDYKEMKVKKSAMKPFYVEKEPVKNEVDFIKFIDSLKKIEWWYKNGDSGSEHFSIPYYDKSKKKERLFYPDWIVKTKEKVWIIDTKSGITSSEENIETQSKEKALKKWLKGKRRFNGGIAIKDGPNGWKVGNKNLKF
ncbi:MAG: DEAD/DEAH box helicase family protein [Candidatus Paceibacterota bacterium]